MNGETPVTDTPAADPVEPGVFGRRRRPAAPVDENGQLLEQPFPGYLVTARLAETPGSTVFRATDTRLDREVAIKALIPDLTHNQDAVELFFNEARNVARLRHPRIVRGLDVGRAGKYFYFAMEFIKGESLADRLARLERGKLAEKAALPIVRQTAEGLQYIFENGLAHRNLKPGNVLLTESGEVKLGDLGVAREVAYATPEDLALANSAYVSPEQARGDFNIDIRSDLYSLGCLWHHLVLGYPPFRGVTPQEVLRKQQEADPANPREQDVRISAATSQLILSLLAKDRDDRPRTPQDFLNRLREHPLLAEERRAEKARRQADEASEELDESEDSPA